MTMMRRFLLLAPLAAALTLSGCGDDDGDPVRDAGGPDDAGPMDAAMDAGTDAGPPRCTDPGRTLGESCATAADCVDGCACNGIELCEEGTCVAGVPLCDDGTECTTDSCDEDSDSCTFEPDHASCQDDDLCNGEELCVPTRGCVDGPRATCVDGDPCTVGFCDPETGCGFELRDLDGDGFADERCGGLDCNDDPEIGASIYPGAEEVCDNALDDNCNRQTDAREITCTGSNDDCATAEALSGPGSYVRTTRGLSSDLQLGCRPTGLDAMFTFTLAERQDVQVRLDVEGGNGAVAIRPLAECGSDGPDAFCANEGERSALTARDLAPGDYAVVVKTSTALTYTLTLVYADPTPVQPVDVCDEDTVDIAAGGTFTGLFTDVFDDYELACRTPSATADRPDVAYRLTITEPKDVILRASTRSTSSITPSTYLTLVRDCGNPDTAIACVQSRDAEIRRRALAPGTYYVLIESSSSTAVSWELQASVVDAMPRNEGDACSTAVDVTDATATLPLDMLELDTGTGCGGTSASNRDGSFSFTLTETRDVILETNVGAIHYLSVATECGNPATETFCTSGTPGLSERLLRVEPGTYWVTVSTALSAGDLEVTARTEDPTFPPANDDCSAPTALEDGVEVRGNLLGASDAELSCGPDGSRDAFHVLELSEARNVTLVARRTDGGTEPIYLGLRSMGCDVSPEDACVSGVPALLNRTLEAGTYHVLVESTASFAGPYSLIAYLAAP